MGNQEDAILQPRPSAARRSFQSVNCVSGTEKTWSWPPAHREIKKPMPGHTPQHGLHRTAPKPKQPAGFIQPGELLELQDEIYTCTLVTPITPFAFLSMMFLVCHEAYFFNRLMIYRWWKGKRMVRMPERLETRIWDPQELRHPWRALRSFTEMTKWCDQVNKAPIAYPFNWQITHLNLYCKRMKSFIF